MMTYKTILNESTDPVFPQIQAAADWRKRNAARFTAASEADLERSDPDISQLTQEWSISFCETNGNDQTADCQIEDLVEEDHEDPNSWIVSFFETTKPRVVTPDPVTETGMDLWVPIITPANELERAMSEGV